MVTITDVSPTRSTMSSGPKWQDVSGRMLSLASSDDGKLVFTGSLSAGLWVSEDGGESWEQLAWEQPAPDQFGVPGALGGCCIPSVVVGPESARWFVDRHPRFLADLTGDKKADIVGFGATGVWTALGNGDGTFQPARVVLADLCEQAGGWQVDKHPRFLADLTGDGRADIVGFGDAGVWTALSNGDGTFQQPKFVIADLGYESGWRVDKHPRLLADLTGDNTADIIGFGDAGVWTALSNGDGTFQPPKFVIADLGYDAGGWRVEKHPRFVADLTGDGRADIIGFGDAGVWTALSNGDGTFQPPRFVIADLGYEAGGWRVEKHPRVLADLTGDSKADIVGFGDAGVWTALSNGDGTFQPPTFVLADFGYEAGGWRVDRHPRLTADLTGDNRADIVAFGDAGIWTALSNGDGTFQPPKFVLADLGYDAGGWRTEQHPRLTADLTGEERADIVGFGDAGVWTALSNADGFPESLRFVLPNFGHLLTVLAIARSDRELQDAGIWRSSDGGSTWAPVHAFPRFGTAPPAAGELVWTTGTSHLVFAAGQNSLAVSEDAGATWRTVMSAPGPLGVPVAANHVAVAAASPGTLVPPAVYALATNMVAVSLDGGTSWVADAGSLPNPIGGATGLANSQNECVMVVSPRSAFEVFVTRDANAAPAPPRLWRGDYTQFAQTSASTWVDVPIPEVGGQDSGNVWLAVTRPGQGEALFYGPQRFFGHNIGEASVAPLDPQSASDWQQLDTNGRVHVDLHGLFLSPDFTAGFDGGTYVHKAGTAWMLSDGGVDRSTDGGVTFTTAGSISSLSTVNFAGSAVPGRGPLLSLNTGDNDGFASRDGGQSWRSQHYGGGDNDTSWSDPLRPHSMLIFAPRWEQTLALHETEPGELPDISSTSDLHTIPGPPLRPGSRIWNASSGYGIAGYRPLVPALPTDDPAQPTDCVVIRFYGNFTRTDPPASFTDHLAVLLRARDLRKIQKRTDWDTPGGWRVDMHPRVLADLTGTAGADIVAFGNDGVWTALSNGDGTFQTPRFVIADFGQDAGGWRVDRHARFLADLTADGRADFVGFGNDGVWTALSNGDGSFQTPRFVLADLGYDAGGWRIDRHPRFLADLTADGRADIVGFGNDGVWTALSNGDGTFQTPQLVIGDLGYEAGGWRVDMHPRFLADLTGDGRADIVGFGNDGVWTALSNGDGTFQPPQFVLNDLGYNAGGWRVDRHPRFLADLTGDGRADIIGFGDDGVWTALGNGDGTFQPPQFVLADLGYVNGGWRVEKHPRFLADLTADGRADIIGFGDAGVYTALSNGDGTFAFTGQPALDDLGYDRGWRVDEHPRFVADVTGDGRGDLVGFGDAGVLVARARTDGTFREQPLFVIPNFASRASGPVEQVGPFLPDPRVGVVQASGGRESPTFYVGGDPSKRLWKWSDGMGAWQPLVPAPDVAQAKRFFVSPYDPNLVYVIDGDTIKRTDDGGVSWRVDDSLQRMVTCDGRIPPSRDEFSETSQVVLSDMQFDPFDPLRRFAVGTAGAFMTTDGAAWQRLLDTGAMRGLPTNCFFDQWSVPSDPSLYVGFAGRGIVRISSLGLGGGVILRTVEPVAEGEVEPDAASVERRTFRVRTAAGEEGTAEIAPDGRLIVTLEDGSQFVAESTEVTLLDAGLE